MIAAIRKNYETLGVGKFLAVASSSLFLSDLLNIYYITSKLPLLLQKWIPLVIKIQSGGAYELTPEGMNEVAGLMSRNLSNTLFIFMIFHTLIYILLVKRKKLAIKYASGYSLMGAILTIAIFPLMLRMEDYFWLALMSIITAIYLYIFLGLRYFKKSLV